jgi:O-antigen/teichoic acid export membrane protein
MIADAFAASFLPAASSLNGGRTDSPFGENKVVLELYQRGARYMNLATSSICALLATISAPILTVWLGKGFPASAYLMTIFAVQQNIHHMTGPGTSILKGIGRPKEELYYIVPNILMTLVAIPMSRVVLGHWSAPGLGSAVVFATVTSAVFFVVHANRILGLSWQKYLRVVITPGLLPYLISIIFAFPAWRCVEYATRWESVIILAGVGVGYAVTLAMAVYRIVLDGEERSWFRSVIARELSRFLRSVGLGDTYENIA